MFVPLTLLLVVPNFFAFVPYFFFAYAVGLGSSHFLITLAVYLQAQNRVHFASSARNRIVYFAVPLAILALFGLSAATDFRTNYPVLSAYVFSGVRVFDFFHVGRQSAGMLRLFERPRALRLRRWLPRAEQVFFVGMALMQWQTFLVGHFAADRWWVSIPDARWAVSGWRLPARNAQALIGSRRDSAGCGAWLPLTYFVFQAVSAAAAVFETRLYVVALAMHYVEYHVIMHPRCFETPLDGKHALDRAAAFVRARPALFYALLAAITMVFELRNQVPADVSAGTRFFVHMFDGIFLVHYFLEAFLWKFSDSFYRRTLAGLYFDARGAASPRAAAAARPVRAGWRSVATALAAALLLAFSWSSPAVRAAASRFSSLRSAPKITCAGASSSRSVVSSRRPTAICASPRTCRVAIRARSRHCAGSSSACRRRMPASLRAWPWPRTVNREPENREPVNREPRTENPRTREP